MNEAITLLAVGMITVFLILGLVVLTGQSIINIVNRFHTEPVPIIKEEPKQPSVLNIEEHLAVLVTAVDIATQGKGRISNIEKID